MISHKVIIIGAGPAGIAAAVQLKRANIDFGIVETSLMGGLLNSADLIENYPGFPEGITGPKLSALLTRHLTNLHIHPIRTTVNKVSFENNKFNLESTSQKFLSESLIVATGTKPKQIPIKYADNLKLRIHSDIRLLLALKKQHIAIIGGGDAAFDYAINLSKRNNVSLFLRSNHKCLDLLHKKALNSTSIEIYNNTTLQDISGSINNLELTFTKDNLKINTDQLLFAIGRQPNLDFLQIDANKIIELKNSNKLFIVGDANSGKLSQASIASGEGMKIANVIINMS